MASLSSFQAAVCAALHLSRSLDCPCPSGSIIVAKLIFVNATPPLFPLPLCVLYGAEVVRLDHGRVPAAAELGEPRLSAAEAGPRRPLPAGRLLPPVQPEPLPGAAALPDAGDPPDAAAGETLRRPPLVRTGVLRRRSRLDTRDSATSHSSLHRY